MLENRILTLQNKLNLVRTREDKKKDLEKEDFEYAPRVIQHCISVFAERRKKLIIDVVTKNDFAYAVSVKELNSWNGNRQVLDRLNEQTPGAYHTYGLRIEPEGSQQVEEFHTSILGLLQNQNPMISMDLIFEIYKFTSKDLLKTTSILYKMSNNVKNGGNPQQYWLNYKWNHDQGLGHLNNTVSEVPSYVAAQSARDSTSQSESESEKTGRTRNIMCFDCGISPKYLHF